MKPSKIRTKKIKAWAVVSQEGEMYLSFRGKWSIYYTRQAAYKDAEWMDEAIVPVEITILPHPKPKKK